jgi:hypothetical protein
MWVWDQSEGKMYRKGHKETYSGYSGRDWGKNNPAAENAPGIGPIPAGLWKMTGVKNSPNTGPFTIVLEPDDKTDNLGRSAFRIHGDSIKNPGTASHGCIILPRAVREKIYGSDDHELQVIH